MTKDDKSELMNVIATYFKIKNKEDRGASAILSF